MTNKNYYTPQQDGVAGFEEFGDIEHGSNYEECRPVYVDGVRMVGPTSEPALVAEFFRKGGTIEKGPVCIAKGAHRFTPGWDYAKTARESVDRVYRGEHGYCVSRGVYDRGTTAGYNDDVAEGNAQA